MFYKLTILMVQQIRGAEMGERLSGQAMFFDSGHSVLLGGRLVLSSDGKGYSEIVLKSLDGAAEERLTFRGAGRWIPVHQLIQVIRETFDASAVIPPDTPMSATCATCGGTGGGNDADGNWRDCPACA
jgi:hypothetical protein